MYPTTKQFIQSVQWNNFKGGYGDSVTEVPSVLDTLCDAEDEDEIYALLYSDLLSHLKQGYEVFEITVPVIQVFSQLCEEGFSDTQILLDFLGYVYNLDIRLSLPILTLPVRYNFAFREDGPSHGFTAFKTFFKQYFYKTGSAGDVYYTAILFPDTAEINRIFSLIGDNAADAAFVKNAVIAAAVINYQNTEKVGLTEEVTQLLVDDETLVSYVPVFNGISGFVVQEAQLQELMDGSEDTDLQWAQAFTTVVAIDALLIGNLADATRLRAALDVVFPVLEARKHEFEEEEQEFEFPLYPFLAEDVTSIIFRNLLNRGRAADIAELDEVQQYCFERLQVMKIHTHAMLHAGLLPEGVTPETQPTLLPIYNYTI